MRIHLSIWLAADLPFVVLSYCDEAVGEGLAGYEVLGLCLGLGEESTVEVSGTDEVYWGGGELFVVEVAEGHPEDAVIGEVVEEFFAELGGPFRGLVGPVAIPL